MDRLSMKSSDFVSLAYLEALMGPLGLFQHAAKTIPRLEEGYCTDDNARLLQLLGELGEESDMYLKAWQFVREAQTPDGSFRNFRATDGTWLDAHGTEDTLARVARSLTSVMAHDSNRERQLLAQDMLEKLLPHLQRLTASRAVAESVIALTATPAALASPASQATSQALWRRLRDSWPTSVTSDWPWPEPHLTYANALLPHGLLAGAMAFPNDGEAAMPALHSSAEFLIKETIKSGLFIPIGNRGWYVRGQERAVYDQQPIEAHTMFDFLLAYGPHAREDLSVEDITAPYLWFHGRNSQGVRMANPADGSAFDGLNTEGPNPNQGAESQLAYVRSELLLKQAPASAQADVVRRVQVLRHQPASAMSPT